MAEIGERLKYSVYYAARDGMDIILSAKFKDRSEKEVTELLNEITEEDGQKCSPLLIAARNGHDKVIEMLLSKFKPNIEQEGTVKFDGHAIEGASPLWCAAGAGHIHVVKSLIRYGANVNHPTKTQSTPLRAACFDGRLDIVQYLLENNADLHIANKYNNTCLMIASYKGYLDVVKCLLKKGADPNERDDLCGDTALHLAAECGHVEVVMVLLEYGAKIMKQEQGMTPIIAAAERTKSEVVEYLISRPDCGKEEKIEALELLGASFANDKDNYSINNCFKYLEMAMICRFEGPEVLPKPKIAPIQAYDNRVECANVDELQAIRNDTQMLHMEGLVIRERILGSLNEVLPFPIYFRGAVFADNGQFDRCVALWLHALKLRLNNRMIIRSDLQRFAGLFARMIHDGAELPFDYVKNVLECAVIELERNQEKLCGCSEDDKESFLQEEMDSNIHTVLNLVFFVTRLLEKCSEDEKLSVRRILNRLIELEMRIGDGHNLLHLTLDFSNTSQVKFVQKKC